MTSNNAIFKKLKTAERYCKNIVDKKRGCNFINEKKY